MKNRNLITAKDVEQLKTSLAKEEPIAVQDTQPTADDFLDRLMKYVPIEVIGLYTVIEVNLKGLVEQQNLKNWLLGLLVLSLICTFLYVKYYLKVIRTMQVFMSVLAVGIWVFSIGGWFGEFDFWAAGWGVIAVAIYAVIIKIMKLNPLPADQ